MNTNVIISRCFLDADAKLKKSNTRISLTLDEWEKLKGAVEFVDIQLVWETFLEEYLDFMVEVAMEEEEEDATEEVAAAAAAN